MEFATQVTDFNCPKCGPRIVPQSPDRADVTCPHCGWKGRAYLFKPVRPPVVEAVEAIPEDATCAHHPAKRAVAVCEGTGNYICSLCLVELDGKKYSVQYVDSHGTKALGETFVRRLERPDYKMAMFIVLLLTFIAAPVFAPFVFYYVYKMRKFRKENELFGKILPAWKSTMYSVFAWIVSLLMSAISLGFWVETCAR